MTSPEKRHLVVSIREALEFKAIRMMYTVVFLASILALALGYSYFFWQQVFLSGKGLPRILENAGIVGPVLLLILALIAILIVWISVIVSIQIVGPLKRLEQDLTVMASGEIPEPLKFRHRDEVEFHMLTLPFNELVERFRKERAVLIQLRERTGEVLKQAREKTIGPEEVLVKLEAQEQLLASLTQPS